MLRRLDASAFAFVMATGIVSVAASLQGLPALSETLLWVACLAWVTLALALSLRGFRQATSTRPRFASFAFVAATAVLGTRFALMGHTAVAFALLVLAASSWLALLPRRRGGERADGGWFLIVVGTESLAVLASLLAQRWGEQFLDAALACWLLGVCLYPAVAAAIGAELHHRPRFGPDLWITMGALAIATLAGTEILLAGRTLHALDPLRGWLRGSNLVTWALASAWILPLAAAELRHRADWRNYSGRWSFVFPLGMYAAATQQLARATPLGPLAGLARVFFVIALVAWALVSFGFIAARFRTSRVGYNDRNTI
jgi:tellurite resistance protein TehA-like permease